MDNSLYEALIGADLSRRDMKAALVIHRLTTGYNVAEARIAASVIATMANMDRTQASKAVCSLIEQRVVYRVGGSRGKLGLCPISEWKIQKALSEPTYAQSAKIVSLSEHTSAHYKDNKETTNSIELVNTPAPVQAKPKAKRKTKTSAFGIDYLMANNPHELSEKILNEYLNLRKFKRAPVSETVWQSLNDKLSILSGMGVSGSEAMTVALEAGWQGFEVDWVMNRIRRNGKPVQKSSGPDFDDISWAQDLGPF